MALLRLAAAEVTLTVYNTGDLHEHTANLPRIAAFVDARKATDPHVLFVDCGDLFNRGDPEYMVTRGEAMFATLAACRLDAAILGNHDLSFGTARAVELLDRFRHPLVDANTVWPEDLRPAEAPAYRLVRLPGVTVALVGTASEHINHASDRLVTRRPVPLALREVLPRAAAESDIVIVLTHVGTERDESIAAALGEAYAGRPPVDLILGAHDHAAYAALRIHTPSGIAIQHSGDHGRWLGETTLVWDGTRVSGRRSRLIPITPEMPEDGAVVAIRARYRALLPADRPLVRLTAPAEPLAFAVWLGRLAALQAHADVALLPPNAVRKALPAGDILPATLVGTVTRLEPLCFTLPCQADLQARLDAVVDPAHRPVLCAAGAQALARGPLRVAWFCVAVDTPTPTVAELGPLAAGLGSLERQPGLDLWEVVIRAAAEARERGVTGLTAELPGTVPLAPASGPASGGVP